MNSRMMMRLLLIFLTLISPLSLISNEDLESQKIYIEPTQVGFSQKEIFVKFDEEWVQVDALRSDDNGLFIQPPQYGAGWKCKQCGTGNEAWRFICRKEGCMGTRPVKPNRPTIPPKPPVFKKPVPEKEPLPPPETRLQE